MNEEKKPELFRMGEENTLTWYFRERDERIAKLDDWLDSISQVLLNRIPEGLEGYRNETFSSVSDMANFILTMHSVGQTTEKMKPEDYGFTDQDDAYTKMNLLKEAWAGWIDVALDADDHYLQVRYSFSE